MAQQLGKLLAAARATNVRSTALTMDMVSKLAVRDGYALLDATSASLAQDYGWQTVGYKVGATSQAVQQRVGLNEPFWGPLYSQQALAKDAGASARFSVKEDLIRGIEAEFAFKIKRDIVPRDRPYEVEELVLDYCSWVTPCVEVCASRVQPALQPLTPVLIGDTGNLTVVFPPASASADLCLPASQVYEQLKLNKTSIKINGEQVSSGSGADVLGSPVLSLQWFANHVVNGERQLTIPAGHFVITGATCGLVPITQACYARATFAGVFNCEIDLAFRE